MKVCRSLIWTSIVLVSWIFALLLGGCAQREHLPEYRWADAQSALHTLAQRAAAVKTVSAQCQLTLTRADGQSVRLDGAIVMQPPDRVRLRAWKLGQAVFDLTLTPDGLWVAMPPDEQNRKRIFPASLDAGKMARTWALLSGEFFIGDEPRVVDNGGSRFRIERIIEGQRITCDVDRATLTPRQYMLIDPAGKQRLELREDHYRQIDGIPWPTHLTARSESGVVIVDMTDIELNSELPPAAFVPPRRAERIENSVATDGHG